MTKSSTLLSIDQFAFNVGAHRENILSASSVFHTTYNKGDDAQKRDLRVRWMCSHIQGALQTREDNKAKATKTTARVVTITEATKIRDAGKGGTASKAHVALIDCAYSDFRYNVVQNKAKGKDVTRNSITLSPEQRAAMKALDMSCGTIAEMKAVFAAYVANMKAE